VPDMFGSVGSSPSFLALLEPESRQLDCQCVDVMCETEDRRPSSILFLRRDTKGAGGKTENGRDFTDQQRQRLTVFRLHTAIGKCAEILAVGVHIDAEFNS
jgi:hypothetical protein